MILWINIKKIHFLSFCFRHFYYMLGGNLWSLLYGDVSVMMAVYNTSFDGCLRFNCLGSVSGPEVKKTLNSADHEIYYAHKCKNANNC